MNQEQNPAVVSTNQSAGWRMESWASGIITALVFLLPISFISVTFLQQNAVKGYLVIFGVLASAILYAISRIKNKSFEWIAHPLSYVGAALALVFIASSIWSGNFIGSFFGQGYEYYTAAFFIILLLSTKLSALFSSRSPSRALSIYAAILASFVVLALFQIIKLFGPSLLSFGIFNTATTLPIGTWYDFDIFSGIAFILTGIAFLYFPMVKTARYLNGVLFGLSFFFLALINMSATWLGIALVFLALALQKFFAEKKGSPVMQRLSIFALSVFVVSALFIWNGNAVNSFVVKNFGTSYSEVHLPWQMTLDIGTGIIKTSPILGSGPNTFAKEYLLFKPLVINQTQFWSDEFSSGSGLVLTMALSLGLSGIILFYLLYVYFIRAGIKMLIKTGQKNASENQGDRKFSRYISYSSFFIGAFLLCIDLAYVPSYADLFLTFVFIGIFLGSSISSGDTQLVTMPFQYKDKPAIYARSCATLILAVLCVGFIWYGMKTAALGYFVKGASSISAAPLSLANINTAKNDFKKALALDPLDTYDQALTQTDLVTVSTLAQQISSTKSKPTQDQIQQIEALIAEASGYAANAIKRDPSNYANYLSEAQAYSTAASLQVTGAYSSAVTAFGNATKYDPYNPSIYLSLAQLAASQTKYDDATSYLGSALQLKNNYTDAVYLLSQIQVVQGKTADAITSVKFETQLTPNDPTIFFELGILDYNAGQYSDAATALERAITLSPNYANAQYFLGLSYAKTGDMNDAINQFQQLAKSNPDNADVASILKNLTAGKAPFANQTPPTSTPEKRSSLPVKEESTNTTTQ